MTISRPASQRRLRRPGMPPWQLADYALGFLLGLALGAMAIDHGMREARSAPDQPRPVLRTQYPGP